MRKRNVFIHKRNHVIQTGLTHYNLRNKSVLKYWVQYISGKIEYEVR